MDQRPILFNDSNQYFPDANILQSSIGFVSPLDIDIYIKTSFGILSNQVMITWGAVECFNKDHLVDERFICYKIEGLDNKPLLKTEGFIKFNLEKQGFLSNGLIQGLIQGTPLISLLFLSLLTRILPATIANIFMYISIIGLLITCCFYARKIIKMFYLMIKSKEIDYNGIGIQYEKKGDMLSINDQYIDMLKQLNTTSKIQNIYLSNGTFYLKQITHKTTFWESIKNIFRTQTTNDQETKQTIETTVWFLLSTPFIWNYTPNS